MKNLTKKALAMELIGLCEEIPLKDIRIKDFIEYTNISKQTFYNYFKDKADLMNYVFEVAARKIVDDMDPSIDGFYDSVIRWTQVCLENRKFYIQLAKYETQNNFTQYFIKTCEAVYEQKLINAKGPAIIDTQMRQVIHIHCVGYCTFLVEWIQNGMKEPPEQIAEILLACFPVGIQTSLEAMQ
ncbi:MAG: TetR family transcriptional regulator C-terminal domain-containing protein [Lachnospiraceae bacterium]|nr:TetR family transcriptional regulator C-terminal domain-containing protein [Lachnospiraceae bacterium]